MAKSTQKPRFRIPTTPERRRSSAKKNGRARPAGYARSRSGASKTPSRGKGTAKTGTRCRGLGGRSCLERGPGAYKKGLPFEVHEGSHSARLAPLNWPDVGDLVPQAWTEEECRVALECVEQGFNLSVPCAPTHVGHVAARIANLVPRKFAMGYDLQGERLLIWRMPEGFEMPDDDVLLSAVRTP